MAGLELTREQDMGRLEEEGQVLHLVDPVTGEPAYDGEGDTRKPVTITIAGRLSTRYRRAEDAQNRLLRRPSLKAEEPSAEALEDRKRALIAACILDWYGLVRNGEPFPCTAENVDLLLRTAPRLREWLWIEIHNDAAFFVPSSSD